MNSPRGNNDQPRGKIKRKPNRSRNSAGKRINVVPTTSDKIQLESNDLESADTTQPQTESDIESNIENQEAKNEINTIFENPREYLLEKEKEHKTHTKNKVTCPELQLLIQKRPIMALIDTGSKITCISETMYDKNIDVFKKCPILPLANLQAFGFTGEKSVRLKKQVRASIKIGELSVELDFIIVPKLVRECIIGIDAQKILKTQILVDRDVISFQPPDAMSRVEFSYINTEITNHERGELNDLQSTCMAEHANQSFINLIEEKITETESIEVTDEEIHDKIDKLTDLSNENKARLKALIFKYRSVFKKIPGRFKNFEYTLEFKGKAPYFHKSYPIPLKYMEKVDAEIEKMLRYGIIERSRSEFLNPVVPIMKRNGTVRVCIDGRELNSRLVSDHDGPEDMEVIL